MQPIITPHQSIEEIFIALERWVCFHPLGALLLVLVAWGLWFRKARF